MWSRIWSSAQSTFSQLWKAISGWIWMRVLATCRPLLSQRRGQTLVRGEGTRRAAAQSAEPAVAVLVFLARSAGAGIVAADLAPSGGVLRIDVARRAVAISREGGRQRGGCEVVLAGGRIDVVRLHVGEVLRLLRGLLHDLGPHQLRGDAFAQALNHRLEQVEGLRLVFVERVALAVAAQSDHLAQILEHQQVLAPKVIKGL